MEKALDLTKSTESLSAAIDGLFSLFESPQEACDTVMDILGTAMGTTEATTWDKTDRSTVTHLSRHLQCHSRHSAIQAGQLMA
jgi:hypothetical protein